MLHFGEHSYIFLSKFFLHYKANNCCIFMQIVSAFLSLKDFAFWDSLRHILLCVWTYINLRKLVVALWEDCCYIILMSLLLSLWTDVFRNMSRWLHKKNIVVFAKGHTHLQHMDELFTTFLVYWGCLSKAMLLHFESICCCFSRANCYCFWVDWLPCSKFYLSDENSYCFVCD